MQMTRILLDDIILLRDQTIIYYACTWHLSTNSNTPDREITHFYEENNSIE